LVRSEEPRAGDVERVRQDDDRSCSVPAAERFGEPSLFVRGYAFPTKRRLPWPKTASTLYLWK
jgi:hypothetical protein